MISDEEHSPPFAFLVGAIAGTEVVAVLGCVAGIVVVRRTSRGRWRGWIGLLMSGPVLALLTLAVVQWVMEVARST